MIIGKSLTALGGGGLKPEIIVTAKAGALLNLHFKDSSIILQSYQLGADEAQHTFVVNVSETAYVVEDVTNSASVEVLVDAVAQYSVQIPYVTYLYKDGDPCEDITGGWISYGGSGYGDERFINTGSVLYGIAKTQNNGYGTEKLVRMSSSINAAQYSQLNFMLDYAKASNTSTVVIHVWDVDADQAAISKTVITNSSSTFSGLVSLDVSNCNFNVKVIIRLFGSPVLSNYAEVSVSKIWLE